MCRIKFSETLKINIGVPTFPKKSNSRKTVFLKNYRIKVLRYYVNFT